MLYFIKEDIIHTYPVAKGCTESRDEEQLRDTVPYEVKQCPYCMKVWPSRKEV